MEDSLGSMDQRLARTINDFIWGQRMADIAIVDKVRFTGPPPRRIENPSAPGASNGVIISSYVFLPKTVPGTAKLPLLVYAHSGVHGQVNPDEDLHVVRELVDQGYAVIAPDYRGSTGYGREFYQLIDYGGLEVEDVFAAREWMLGRYSVIDPARVGILGWSHGGLITLMNLFEHPKDFQAAYAGVPVSDLVARMGYKDQSYRDLFSAPYHIGQTAEQNPQEYRRRSPAWQVEKLQTPLLIQGTTNDEDVNILEIEHLIKALKAAGKNFECKIYTNAPGGHQFSQLDTPLARDARKDIYRFLAKYLTPPNPVK